MNITRNDTLGEFIYRELDKNDYLNQLYKNLIYNYSIKLFNLNLKLQDINDKDLLRFADLLSKSCFTDKSDFHKNISQNIVVLENIIGNQNIIKTAYSSSVLKTLGNYAGLMLLQPNSFKENYNDSILEKAYSSSKMQALKMPDENDEKYYLHIQKNILNEMNEDLLSYSGPTSMGKSMLMKKYVASCLAKKENKNYAIIIPSKALINEVSDDFIKGLNNELKENNYIVVTSAGSLALERKANYLFVMTPERLLYLMIKYPDINISSIFIDEAHKISSNDDRSSFYYKIIEMAYYKNQYTKFVFASPNIPNPEVYTKIVTKLYQNTNHSLPVVIHSEFSPVVHIQYYIDFITNKVQVYNDLRNDFDFVCNMNSSDSPLLDISLPKFIKDYGKYDLELQSLVYCNSKDLAINYAIEYAKQCEDLNIDELNDFAKLIERDIDQDYLLPELIKKGVAYHVGYLPAYIREQIEKLYRSKKIRTIFCTSTLIEGVNLPANNLFILNYNKGSKPMSAVEFKNMVGRVGRLGLNLYGNAFVIRYNPILNQEDFINLMTSSVDEQKLSIFEELTGPQKEKIIDELCRGNTQFPIHPKKQTENSYSLMRKFALILLSDIKHSKKSIVYNSFEKQLNMLCTDQSILLELYKTKDIKVIKEDVIKLRLNKDMITVDDDINVSHDQKVNLISELNNNLSYPALKDGKVDYNDLLDFLLKLSKIFKWEFYEKSSLGSIADNGKPKYLIRYATILTQWMNGNGLNLIVKSALRNKHEKFVEYLNYTRTDVCKDISNPPKYPPQIKYLGKLIAYDPNNRLHRNIVIGETLDTIDKIILFKIANYFLRFSTEYKKKHGIGDDMDNDWYEYVEYGTTAPLSIFLQRNGFKRETAEFIKNEQKLYVVELPNKQYKIKNSIFKSKIDLFIKENLETVKLNIPDIFID